ncbi:hypothetical protein PFISCL1PPCAC_2788, partial [Pristionchus fissidentatus]
HIQELTDGFPEDMSVRLQCFNRSTLIVVTILTVIISGLWCVALFLLLFHTLHMLNGMNTISDATKFYHQQMAKSLIFQATIPIVTIIAPVFVCFAQFAAQFENTVLVPLMLKIIGLSSIVHSITLILTTRSFRRVIIRKV